MSRDLIIVRHGQAEPAAHGDDFNRRLTPQGIEEVSKIPEFLNNLKVIPEICAVSPATRTKETASKIMSSFRNTKLVEVPGIYKASAHELLDIITDIENADSLMVIGHNPAITSLLMLLKVEHKHGKLYQKAMNYEITAKTIVLRIDSDHWKDAAIARAKIIDVFYP